MGFGEAKPPREISFVALVGGSAADQRDRRKIFGGTTSLHTSLKQSKQEKCMPNEQQVPSLVIRQVCDSIIDSLGAKSLRLLFAQSGLQRFYSGGDLPPADDTPSATVDQLSRLFATAFRIFGDKGVKPIL